MKFKKILYLALNFPKIGESNTLYTDLMEEFRDHGHEVYIVASAMETGKAGLFKESGLNVLRIKTLAQRNVNLFQKGVANLLLSRQYIKAIEKNFKDIDFDLIILPTPPITLVSVIQKIKKNIPVYLILRDIFPQNAVDLNLFSKNSPPNLYFRNLENKLYNLSDTIGCMSEGNIVYVKKHNPTLNPQKLHILRNWQREQLIDDSADKELIKDKYDLKDKFIIFFGGNISKPQKIENIVKLALLYKDNKDVVFFIVGKGTEKKKLVKIVEDHKLEQVIVKDFLPRKDYQELMLIANIGLVSLDERFTIPNIPSKSLSYFNSKIPVAALLDPCTDFGDWIENEVKAGYWSLATQPEELKVKIDTLLDNKELQNKLGQNGYDYFIKELNPTVAYQTIIDNSLKIYSENKQ